MEDSVKVLEAMFNKAESDLDFVARKVDAECTNLSQGAEINPAEVLKRLEDIKKEYAGVVAEAQAIQQAQKEAMGFIQGQLVDMVTAVTQLQQQTPLQAEKSQEATKLESLLGITLPSPSQGGATGEQCSSQSEADEDRLQVNQSGDHSHGHTSGATAQAEAPAPAAPELSPFERRLNSSECIDVDEREFQGVSQLVRGRVKLCEVNHIYRILWHHFKEEGNSSPLNAQQMYKMGLKVTGQTGEAKLKVLRSLKLLSLSKKGEVQLL